MRRLAAFVVAAGSVAAAGCATNRSALQPLQETDIRPSPGVTASAAAPGAARTPAVVSRAPVVGRATGLPPARTTQGPMAADAFARRNGLTYQDGGSYVLLSGAASRLRLYPGSNRISLDGREIDLRGRIVRQGSSVILPGPCVSYLESSLRSDSTHLARVRADASRPTVAAPRAPAPSLARSPKPAARGTPSAARSPRKSAAAEPGWEPLGVQERPWRWIVLHHSDDRSGNAAKYNAQHLSQGWENGLGYHFVIGNGTMSGDGQVEVGGRWQRQIQGAHAKTDDNCFNEHGIGICLVGDFENHGRPSGAQMNALVHLCRWLMERYRIPIDDVKGHCDCKPTACPGKHFPWAELRARLVSL